MFNDLDNLELSQLCQGFRSSASLASITVAPFDVVRPVEAKYPALLFKQQLTAYVEKIYGIIRDNLKKELTSYLSLCIQVNKLEAVFTISLLKLLKQFQKLKNSMLIAKMSMCRMMGYIFQYL